MPKSREYCCCAIPLVNAGIYATLVEQTVLGIIVGALSFATPSSRSFFSTFKYVLYLNFWNLQSLAPQLLALPF